ncbi:MAG: GldG family protein [Planctomycetes bacterium]|nr:GldG family protein [Planctomycetota bacterium]
MSNDETKMTNSPTEGWGKKQKALTWLNVLVMILVALAILAGVNYVSSRQFYRHDCTFSNEYSLSDKSKELIGQLKAPLTIYTFFGQPRDRAMYDAQRIIADLLEEYKIYSKGMITLEIVNVIVNPSRVDAIQKEYKLETLSYNDILLLSGDTKKTVNLTETYETEYGQYGQPGGIKSFKGEERLTSAIMTMVKTQKITVYFTMGHNEGDIANQSPEGFSTFVQRYLQEENIETKKLNLLETTEIPRNCSALIILGPKAPVSAPERNLISNYLKNGGRALITVDPLADTGLTELLAEWNVRISDGIVLDAEKCAVILGMKDISCIAAETYGNHPITNKMRGEASILPGARAVESISPTIATDLLKSSGNSWLETNIEDLAKGKQPAFNKDSDRRGPISLGVAVTKKETDKETRLVVIGNSGMIQNKLIDGSNPIMGFGRVDLALNSVKWLTGQEVFITIEPKKVEDRSVKLTPGRLAFLFWFSLLMVPAIGAAFGIAMWLIRRK